MTDETNFFWLVGLLEGEGSFLKPSPSKPREPKIDVEMTDEDVIRRLSALFGVGYRRRDRHRANASVTYHIRLAGKGAVRLMWRLKPYMSARRQQQINRAVQCYIDRGIKWHPDNLPVYGFAPVCANSLCAVEPLPLKAWCAQHLAEQQAAQTAAFAEFQSAA